jgi:predicted secreted protein
MFGEAKAMAPIKFMRHFLNKERLKTSFHRMKTIGFVLALMPIWFACGAPAALSTALLPPKTAALVQEDCPTKRIILKKGATFVLKLKAYPSKGYSWALNTVLSGSDAVVFKGRTVEAPDPAKMDGAANFNIFTFTGAKAGEVTLQLKYARPFDKVGVKPLETCIVKLLVQ